jgi:hypothetical protein
MKTLLLSALFLVPAGLYAQAPGDAATTTSTVQPERSGQAVPATVAPIVGNTAAAPQAVGEKPKKVKKKFKSSSPPPAPMTPPLNRASDLYSR